MRMSQQLNFEQRAWHAGAGGAGGGGALVLRVGDEFTVGSSGSVDASGGDEEARELYERALMVPPVNVAVVVNLGILYEDMGNYRRGIFPPAFDTQLISHQNGGLFSGGLPQRLPGTGQAPLP